MTFKSKNYLNYFKHKRLNVFYRYFGCHSRWYFYCIQSWYFYFCLLIPMRSYASNLNTTLEIMVFLRDKITPKCHLEWHKTPTEKQASYLVRVSKRHQYLFLLEAINAPITKKTPASPPEPCSLDLHRRGCSLFGQSANEPWQHGTATPRSWPALSC
jgi:hypothetical protein